MLDEQGRDVRGREIGSIYVRGPRLDFRYRGAEEKTRAAFRDGFFTAGDLGWSTATAICSSPTGAPT